MTKFAKWGRKKGALRSVGCDWGEKAVQYHGREEEKMDCSKVGALIRALREEAGLTQLQLAEKLGVSDRAVSKWECGRGAPDVTLLGALGVVS